MSGRSGPRPGAAAGAATAFGAGALLGAYHVLLASTGVQAGLWPLVMTRSTTVVLAGLTAVVLRYRDRLASQGLAPRVAGLAAVVGVVEVAGSVMALTAVRDSLVIAGPIVGLYPAGTVLLAWLFAGERVGWR